MKDLTISPEITIRIAMKELSKTAENCLIVVDEKKCLIGTLTDGDLRKAILKGVDIEKSIKGIYCTTPTYSYKNEYSLDKIKETFLEKKLVLLPIVDKDMRVVDALLWKNVFKSDEKMISRKAMRAPVVIMAGGEGSRLEPFTKVLPKPLVPIHEKPVIEHIINRFTSVGVNDFYLTVNYKSRILKAFFEELKPEYSVKFVEEQEPLGTAGGLKLLEETLNETFLVTNCDIIIDVDYADLYSFHKINDYDITLVASMKNFVIPYGTCELNGNGYLECIKEKPEHNLLVNTGLYLLNPEVIRLIPEQEIYHMTKLINDAKSKDLKVGVYPIDDDAWIDIGQWSEYKSAIKKFEAEHDCL